VALKPRLSPGRYRLAAYRDGALLQSKTFEVADDDPLTIDLDP
jgi:hypothetical protein